MRLKQILGNGIRYPLHHALRAAQQSLHIRAER
jgi:hypothetical protein